MNKVKSLLELLEAGKSTEPVYTYRVARSKADDVGVEKTIKASDAVLLIVGPYDANWSSKDRFGDVKYYEVSTARNELVIPYFYHLFETNKHRIDAKSSRGEDLRYDTFPGTSIKMYSNSRQTTQTLWYRTNSFNLIIAEESIEEFKKYIEDNFHIKSKVESADTNRDNLKSIEKAKQDAEAKRLADPKTAKDDPALNDRIISEFRIKACKSFGNSNITINAKYIRSRKEFEIDLDVPTREGNFHIERVTIGLSEIDKLDEFAESIASGYAIIAEAFAKIGKAYHDSKESQKPSGFYKEIK